METMVMLLFWDLGDTWASAPLLEGVASAAPIPAVSDVKWTTAPGSTNGIREETSRALALRGVHVAMAVRNVDAGKNLKEKILEKIPAAKIDVMELGISLLVSVKKFASEFKSSGIMATPFQLSKDNIELQFAINHLGG